MSIGTLFNIQVSGVCCAVPVNSRRVDDDVDVFGEESVTKFSKMTGVKQRFVSNPNQTSSDLCYKAAEALLERLNWDRSSIDAIIFVSQTPDYRLPATSCVLHKRLDLKQDCIAFDVNLGCSGYVYGMQIVGSLMQNITINRALLLCGDTINSYLSPNDKSTTMLFGDAGSATALEKNEGKNIRFSLKTKGSGFKSIIIPSGGCRKMNGDANRIQRDEGIFRSDFDLAMDGTEVFNFTISDIPKSINEFLSSNNEDVHSYNGFVLHQANLFMLNHIAKKVKIPAEKLPITIDRFGNTSVASIPLTMCDMYNNREGTPSESDHLLLVGFGVGLSWGIVSLDINPETCMPIIYTDDYYLED